MFKIKPNITKANPAKETELLYTISIVESLVNSEVFESKFLNMKLTQNYIQSKHTGKEPVRLSNMEILDMLLKAHEVEFHFYDNPDPDSATGKASFELQRIRFNISHWGDTSKDCLTLIHEFMHLLGFGHRNSFENHSVPFSTGYLIRKMYWDYGYESGKELVYHRPWFFLWLFKFAKWK